MYLRKSIETYLKDLSAKKSAPGGGSAAGLTAALGASLACMVLQFSAKNNRTAALLKKAGFLRKKFACLTDDDITVYQKVSLAYKLPKSTETQKARRRERIQRSLKSALSVCEELCELCYEGMMITKRLLRVGNEKLISDTGISLLLFEAAYQSSLYNVKINLRGIKDINLRKKVRRNITALSKKVSALKIEVVKRVDNVL
ncbi:MAG: cyclodeaminase/cyclohydrolase family protein [Candidatus Omnitrophica bacterium]|nr:cyclodeaminase/cyclohydrolase family protein [Candidatus Omnitrophota bacterium]